MTFPMIRRYFLTGLIILVPVFITYVVLATVVGTFSNTPIGELFDQEANRLLFNKKRPPYYPGFGLVATLGIILATGVVASTVLGHRVFGAIEALLMKTPLVNVIYPSAKQIIDFALAPKGQGFRSVVLVEFPHPGAHAIGFITGEAPVALWPTDDPSAKYVSVFIPFAPAPMSGALIIVREDQVTPTTMSVEEAFKFIISAGVLAPTKEVNAKVARGA